MFESIRSWWRDVKIDADFLRFEAQARSAHQTAAATRFSTKAQQVELDRLMEPHRQRCEEVFGGPIRMVTQALARLEATISETEQQIEVLNTDYQALLEPLYKRSRQIKEDWDSLVAQKRRGHDELESARESISPGITSPPARASSGTPDEACPITPCLGRASVTSTATSQTAQALLRRSDEPRRV